MLLYNNPGHLLRWGGTTACLMVLGVGTRIWFSPGEAEALPGGGVVGLLFGVLGGLLILFALSLSLLRFVPSWWFIGSRAALAQSAHLAWATELCYHSLPHWYAQAVPLK